MGRKIPGKKHRGVKDPLEQLEKRNASLSTKCDAPPVNPDFQDVPKSLIHLMKLKQSVKDGKFKQKKSRKKKNKGKRWLIDTGALVDKDVVLPGMTRPDKPVPRLVQRPGESAFSFMYRLEQACQEVIKETQFEDKFGVDVIRDSQTGEVTGVAKRPKDLIECDKNIKRKSKDVSDTTQVLSKTAKRKQKKLMKKQMREGGLEEKDFSKFKDHVKFGEVVHEPPQLRKPRKVAENLLGGRPGKKNLLLKSFMENEKEVKDNKTNKEITLKPTTVKRKKLPAAEARKLEMQRFAAIEAYRSLKERKLRLDQ